MSKVKKIVVLGSIGSGKSSLLKKLIGHPFLRDEAPTMGLRVYSLPVNDPAIDKLVFWELTSAGKLDSQPIDYLKGAHAAIYIFDLSRPSTYVDLMDESRMLAEMLPDIKPLFIANKADLVGTVQTTKLLDQFDKLQPIPYSAKNDESVEVLLNHILSTVK